jgi:hypothetical protein
MLRLLAGIAWFDVTAKIIFSFVDKGDAVFLITGLTRHPMDIFLLRYFPLR